MADSALQSLADKLAKWRTPIQGAGLLLAAGGFFLMYAITPANLAAQLAASLVGVVIAVVAQYFQVVRNIPLEDQARVTLAGLLMGGLWLVMVVSATGYFLQSEESLTVESAAFDAKDPNTLNFTLARTGKSDARIRQVVVDVRRIWMLKPKSIPKEALPDLGDYDVPLDVKKRTPFRYDKFRPENVVVQSGGTQRLAVMLRPVLPEEIATVELRPNFVTELMLTDKAQDVVFHLRVAIVYNDGKVVNAGEFLYMPDLKTEPGADESDNASKLAEMRMLDAVASEKLKKMMQ